MRERDLREKIMKWSQKELRIAVLWFCGVCAVSGPICEVWFTTNEEVRIASLAFLLSCAVAVLTLRFLEKQTDIQELQAQTSELQAQTQQNQIESDIRLARNAERVIATLEKWPERNLKIFSGRECFHNQRTIKHDDLNTVIVHDIQVKIRERSGKIIPCLVWIRTCFAKNDDIQWNFVTPARNECRLVVTEQDQTIKFEAQYPDFDFVSERECRVRIILVYTVHDQRFQHMYEYNSAGTLKKFVTWSRNHNSISDDAIITDFENFFNVKNQDLDYKSRSDWKLEEHVEL